MKLVLFFTSCRSLRYISKMVHIQSLDTITVNWKRIRSIHSSTIFHVISIHFIPYQWITKYYSSTRALLRVMIYELLIKLVLR